MGRVMFPDHLIERRMQVDRAAIKRYADLTNDHNPIHLDPEFAANTPMGGVIAHGMLSLSLLWQSLQATFGTNRMSGTALDIRFVRPVREGDWVTAGGQRADDGAGYQIWVRAESEKGSELVISGTVTIKPLHINDQQIDRGDANHERTESDLVASQRQQMGNKGPSEFS
jgi:3-hydroxybutyryl-CoA dehydratase